MRGLERICLPQKKTSAAGMGPTALSHLVIHATVLLLDKIKTSTKKTSKNVVKMGRHVASPGAEAFSSYINGVFSLDLLLFHVESDRFS